MKTFKAPKETADWQESRRASPFPPTYIVIHGDTWRSFRSAICHLAARKGIGYRALERPLNHRLTDSLQHVARGSCSLHTSLLLEMGGYLRDEEPQATPAGRWGR